MPTNRSSSPAHYTKLVEDDEDAGDDERDVLLHPEVLYVTVKQKESTNTSVGNYSAAVDAAGFGRFHALLLVVCGWANMSDTVEILSVSFLLPSATKDMNLSSTDKGVLTAIIFVGMLVGGYVWGSLADVQGRRKILMYSLACNAIFGLLSSLSQWFWLFLIMRFFSGVGVGGSIPVIFSYFAEFQPTEKRGAMISGLSTFWMFGNILTAALAWAIIPRDHLGYHNPDGFSYESWRIFIAICTLPAATSVFTVMLMPESPKYLLEKGKEQEALSIMKKIYCWNNKDVKPDDYPIRHLIPSCKEDKDIVNNIAPANQTCWSRARSILNSTAHLFRMPLARITVAMLMIIFCLSFGYYGLWMWFPELFARVEQVNGSACANIDHNMTDVNSNIYEDGFITSLSNLPGNILTIFLMDRLGRKFLLTTSLICSGVSVFFIWFLHTRTDVLIMSIVFGAISVISWNSLNVLGVEMYPTSCRSTALGVQSIVNRLGAITGNLLFGILIELHCAIPMLMIAILLAFGGLVTLTLPNTTKVALK